MFSTVHPNVSVLNIPTLLVVMPVASRTESLRMEGFVNECLIRRIRRALFLARQPINQSKFVLLTSVLNIHDCRRRPSPSFWPYICVAVSKQSCAC